MKNFIEQFKNQSALVRYAYIFCGILIPLYYFTFGFLFKVVICDTRCKGEAMTALENAGYYVVYLQKKEGVYPHMTLPPDESIEELKSIVENGFRCKIRSFEISKSPILCLDLVDDTSEYFKPCWTSDDIATFKNLKYKSEAIDFIKAKHKEGCGGDIKEQNLFTEVK